MLAIGTTLILFGSIKNKNNTDNLKSDFSCEVYTKELEEKIEHFLLNVDGIKNVKAIVTLNS